MATGGYFREVGVAEQKHDGNGILFPLVLSPNTESISETAETEMSVFQEAIKAEKQCLESLLTKSGAILFRDFPVSSPSDFNDVVEAFDFPEATYLGGQAPRTKVVGRVYTTNESPLERKIPFHHELAYVPDSPSKLFFFCEEEPGSGGQTPIVLSHMIYDKMKERHPEFVAHVEEHGLIYIKVTTSEERPSSYMGRSWMSTYRTHEKNVAEERAAKLGTKLEWIGNDVKAITGPLPAFRLDKGNQRKTWFNNLAISNTHPMNGKLDNLDTFVEIGNGDLVPDDVKEDCLRILEEECVAIPWKKGDILLVDNFMVLHARQPLLKPPRNILVSLCN